MINKYDHTRNTGGTIYQPIYTSRNIEPFSLNWLRVTPALTSLQEIRCHNSVSCIRLINFINHASPSLLQRNMASFRRCPSSTDSQRYVYLNALSQTNPLKSTRNLSFAPHRPHASLSVLCRRKLQGKLQLLCCWVSCVLRRRKLSTHRRRQHRDPLRILWVSSPPPLPPRQTSTWLTPISHLVNSILPGDTTGYIAADHTNSLLVVSFRDTMSDVNRHTDLEFGQLDISSTCSGCRVHKGFWFAATSVNSALRRFIWFAMLTHPGYRLAVTGHSLGGAIATIYAVLLRGERIEVDLV